MACQITMKPDRSKPREPRLPSDGVVTLSLFRPGDAALLRDGDRDPEHRRRFDFPADFVPSLQHAREVIARWELERSAGLRFPFAVRSVTTGALVGGCELLPIGDGSANVSYWTYRAHRRQAAATRAVALLIHVAFQQHRHRHLEIVTDPDNLPSRRVALGNGFLEAGMRDYRALYTLNRADWPGPHSASPTPTPQPPLQA